MSADKQAITGVAPRDLSEVTIMTVWPSLGAEPVGRFIGQACSVRFGFGKFFTFGKLFALLLIPVALGGFFKMLAPFLCRRYRLTNRRLVVQKGLTAQDERYVGLGDFDAVDLVVLPGQEWYPCGDLVFRKGAIETFRLPGVPHAETFRQVCLKTQRSYAGIQEARERQPAMA